MRTTILTILTLVSITTLSAQNWLENLPAEKSPSELTLFDYQKAFETYWAPFQVDQTTLTYQQDGKTKKAAGWKQFKRWEYEMSFVVDPATGTFPEKTAMEVKEAFERNHPPSRNRSTAEWSPMGPTYSNSGYSGIGRLNCVAFHPSDTNRYWVGAAAGGLWETKDDGATWHVMTDNNGVLAVSDIIIPADFDATGIIYISTGDRDGSDNRSIGVLKSTDSGATWNATGISYTLANNQMVNRLLQDPENPDILFAATTSGVYKTTDGGDTWDTKLTDVQFIDMEFRPGLNNVIYGSTKNGKIYTSTDGQNFDLVLDDGDARRIELAVSPNQPDWVFALAANGNNGLHGIFKSIDAGASFIKIFSGDSLNLLTWSASGDGNDGQGWYDLAMASSPFDANFILVGGVNTWRSMDGGINWIITNHWVGNSSQAVHADKHKLAFRDNGDLFECNDGGVYLSKQNGINWVDKTNGIQISQMYRLGVSQTEPDEVITGLQDNGTKLFSGNNWFDARGGDGMECMIDYTDVNIQYNTIYYGNINRTMNHWQNAKNITPRDTNNDIIEGNWVTPFITDPNNPNILYGGYNEVWKTENRGDDWVKISDMDINGRVRSMAAAATDSLYLYVAGNKALWKTIDGGATWRDLTDSLPNGLTNISYIAVHNDDENTLWLTTTGYGNSAVYESVDGGDSWIDISEGLPPIPLYAIVQNRQSTSTVDLYVGTELGVYYKKGLNDWEPYNDGLPNVKIGEIEIYYSGNPGESKLRAATFGRGLWETKLEYISSPMVYASSTAKQKNTSSIPPDRANQEIIKVEVQTVGNLSPLNVTSFTFNTNGSTSPGDDITHAKLYFSNASNAFSPENQFGQTVISPNGEFTFSDTQELGDGRNNFWLTYDVPASATIGNLLDAQCTSVTIDEPRDLVVSDPDGARIISLKYCDAGATELTYEYISRVRMDTIDNPSGKDPGGYADFSSQSVHAAIGTTLDVLVYNGVPFWADQVLIWVDWNGDGDFLDADETAFISNPSGEDVFKCTVDIPTSAKLGLTKMRIRLHDSQNGAHGEPCGFAQWGEVEDYSIRILPFDPCAALNYFDYNATSIPGDYVDLDTNGIVIVTTEFDNANSDPVDIGFSFEYMCQPFSQFILNTNGFIKLGNTPPSTAALFYDSARTVSGGIFNTNDTADVNILSALNMDLTAGTDMPEYRVNTSGEAPDRICTIQFKNVREAVGDIIPQFDNMQFQIKLYETTNAIEFVYGDWIPSGNDTDLRPVACGLKGLNRAKDQVLLVSKSANQTWDEISFLNSNFGQPDAIYYEKPPESPKPDAGRTLRFIPVYQQDLAVKEIYSMGEASLYFSSPQVVGANIENVGLFDMTDVPVILNISGANSFMDTIYIPSIAPKENMTISFSDFVPGSIGTSIISVTVPGDQNTRNDVKTWKQETTEFTCMYTSDEGTQGSYGGPDDLDYMLLSKYTIFGEANVEAVTAYISGETEIGQRLYGVMVNHEGAIVSLSDVLIVENSDLDAWHTIQLNNIEPIKDNFFYAGILIPAESNISIGSQVENPQREETFFTSTVGSTIVMPINASLRLMIGAVLSATPPVEGTASADQTICEGLTADINLEGSTGTIQWQDSPDGITNWNSVTNGEGMNLPQYTTAALPTTTYFRAEVMQPTHAAVYSNVVVVYVLPLPSNAGPIEGLETICQGEDGVLYTTSAMDDATHYVWSLPEGANGLSDADTIQVSFSAAALSGVISVVGYNEMCKGDSSTLDLVVNEKPATPVISGSDQILLSDAPSGNQWYNENGAIPGATDQEFIATYSGEFYVIVTVNGCSSEPSNMITVVLSSTHSIGINPLIRLYPNPVTDKLYIEAEGDMRSIDYEIHNALGRLSGKGSFSEKAILKTDLLVPGIYFIQLNDDGLTDVRMFVKE